MTTPAERLLAVADQAQQDLDDIRAAPGDAQALPGVQTARDDAIRARDTVQEDNDVLRGQVTDLMRQLADCQAGDPPPPDPPPGVSTIVLGANGSNPPDYSYQRFLAVEQAFGAHLAPARMFDGKKVVLTAPAAECLMAGRPCAYSIAVDVEAGIRGDHDLAVRDIAVQLATVPGSVFLSVHEPEQPPKGIPGPRFVAWQDRFYSLVREAAPRLSVGPAHQSYQYEGPWAARGLDGSYLTSGGDFFGLDYYTGTPKGGKGGVPLTEQPGWLNWYALVRPAALATRKPIRFLEYGVYHPDPTAREDILRRDRDYLAGLNADPNEPDVDLLCLWLGEGNAGDWQTGLIQSAPLLRELYGPPLL